jgi:hypothetical protein
MPYYSKTLRSLKPTATGWMCLDDSTADKMLSTLKNWPSEITLPTKAAIEAEMIKLEAENAILENIQAAKKIRDDALNALVYDFGDGRIMQTRPKDESNIRNAIEIMTANSIPSIGWSMVDDVKQDVTVTDLQTALQAGQLAALVIWENYNP